MNDTFLNTLLELSEIDRVDDDRRPPSVAQHRPSSVLFSRPPSSILVSRPPSAAYFGRPHSALKVKRPPSTSTLKPRPPSGTTPKPRLRPPSVSTIARPSSSLAARHINSLKCNVCTDGFKFPGNVPCFDNYCTKCLEEHILTFKRGTGCDCALCRCAILLPTNTNKLLPIQQARTTMASGLNVCDSCGQSRLAQYRCNKCEEHFCEKCSKDFLRRMRIDSNFNIAHLADLSGDNSVPVIIPGGMEDEESLDSISLPSILPRGFGLRCLLHEEEELRFHCVACDTPVCRDCKILDHEGHTTKSLEEVYEERRTHLAQAVKLANANVRKLHAETAEINSKRLEIDQESRDAISLIENHANEIKKIIDNIAKDMIKTIRTQNTESRGKLQECRDKVKEKVTFLQALVEEGSNLLTADEGIDIVKKAPPIVDRMSKADISPSADRLWRKKFEFREKPLTTGSVAQAFGSLKAVLEGLIKEVPTVDLEMLNTFNCDQKYKQTTAVAPMSDGTVWVCNDYKNKIQLFNAEGQLLRRETLDFDVDDMEDGRNGLLYLTEYNGKLIRRLSDNKLAVFARTDSYLRGISLSRDGDLIMACGNDVPIACLRETAVTKIFTYDCSGQKLKEIIVDTGVRGVSLFRVCHTINAEFVVSTGISALYYIIGEAGELRYRYQAASTADGVACDRHGLIYLSSCRDDTLYVLDGKGVPIPTTYAMHRPTAVAIDRNDTIWVGDWSKIHVLTYKE